MNFTASGMLLPGVNSPVQAVVLLGIAAVQINLALFFFNLLPIPPLDGSQLLRNMLPYNAVQSYDRIPILGQLDADDLCRRLHHAPAADPGFRGGRFGAVERVGSPEHLQPLQWNEPHFDLSDQTWADQSRPYPGIEKQNV